LENKITEELNSLKERIAKMTEVILLVWLAVEWLARL